MSVPKQRRTLSSKKRRASHFALNSTNLHVCPKCKASKESHKACPRCGVYKGKQAVSIKT